MSEKLDVGGLPARFTKMSGAGNDFLVFDEDIPVGPREAETIRRLCRRGTGVGADGVLFVTPGGGGSRPRFVVRYLNADGLPARFCGNGTRCAARFAALATGERQLVMATGWGDVPATVREDGSVELLLPEPVTCGATVTSFEEEGEVLMPFGVAVTVGVPHLVIFTVRGVEVESVDVASLGPLLRRHPELPDGANVNFVSRRGSSRLAVRTFERGVEAETLACGSGVVASAVVAALREGEHPPISVATRSGKVLTVDFRVDGTLAQAVTLTGDARVVFEGTLEEEAL